MDALHRFAVAFGLLAGLVSVSALAQEPAPSHAAWYRDYLAGSRQVRVAPGRTLNLYCRGAGTPTVILEAGLSESADTWWRVQPRMAATTRVCAYDRAGYGLSPAGPLPRDTSAETADLERLLKASGEREPYVLVGHSMGGYNVQLFTSRHPQVVAGVVLVDSSVVDQLPPLEKAIPSVAENDKRAVTASRACADPARDAKTAANCTPGAPKDFPPDLARTYVAAFGLASAQARLSEIESFIGPTSREVAAEQRSWGDIPLVVLTRGARSDNLPAEQAELEWTLLNGLQDGLAKLSRRSDHRVIAGAGHYIHQDRPEAVISAISDVVACARRRGPTPCVLGK